MKNINLQIAERLKAARSALGLSQRELAEKCGWESQSRVGNYELGTRKISAEDAVTLASALGISPGELMFGNESDKVYVQRSYPVVGKVSAGPWQEAIEPEKIRDIEHWEETTKRVSDDSFWLEVDGDSMTSDKGITFPKGMLILVDPKANHEPGSYVIAKLTEENSVTFKKFVIEGGEPYLVPLNNDYKTIPVKRDCKFIGVVKDMAWNESL